MAVKKKKAKRTKKPQAKKTVRSTRRRKISKIQSAKQSILERLEQVNRVINRFENEVEGLIKKLVKQSERSRQDLRKSFDDVLKRIHADDIFARASETRDELEKEVRRLADEVIGALKDVEALLNTAKVSGLFQSARARLNDFVEVLVESGLVAQAKQTVLRTRREMLGLLSIPTQSDVEKLERKIINLERRLSNLSRKAA